jgi:hypothetical protein
MKITIDGDPLEIAKMLQAIVVGKEQSVSVDAKSLISSLKDPLDILHQRALTRDRGRKTE